MFQNQHEQIILACCNFVDIACDDHINYNAIHQYLLVILIR